MNVVIDKIDETIASLTNDRDVERDEEEHRLSQDGVEYVCAVYDQAIVALDSVKAVILGEGVGVTREAVINVGATPRRGGLDRAGFAIAEEALNRANVPEGLRVDRPPIMNWDEVDEDIRAVIGATPLREQAQVRAVGF